MATQKQDEKQGNGGRGQQAQQAITVQRGQQDRQLSRDQSSTTRRLTPSPFSMMRRMLDDVSSMGTSTWTSPFGLSSPFSTMRRMFDDMERLFDTSLAGDVGWRARDRDYVWMPNIEIAQREDQLVVRAELPGIPQDQIQISAEGDALVIEGERPASVEQREDVWCSECARGRFRRVIALPDGVDVDKAVARYENGVLEVSLPLPATLTRGRRIEIQTGERSEGRSTGKLGEGAAQQQQQAEKH